MGAPIYGNIKNGHFERDVETINPLDVPLSNFQRKGEKEMNFDGFTAYTTGELDALCDAKMDEWLKTRRVGVAEYDADLNLIELDVYQGHNGYQIDLDRCKTQKELLDWIFHLSGKTWCKGSVMIDFIHCLEWAIREKEDQSLWEYFKLNK